MVLRAGENKHELNAKLHYETYSANKQILDYGMVLQSVDQLESYLPLSRQMFKILRVSLLPRRRVVMNCFVAGRSRKIAVVRRSATQATTKSCDAAVDLPQALRYFEMY